MGSSIESMKVHHQFTRGLWEDPHHHHHHHQYINTSTNQQYEPLSSLSLGCKRLRPLAPKLNDIGSGGHGSGGGGGGHGSSGGGGDNQRVGSLDLKSFIRPESGHRKLPPSSVDQKKDSTQQVETHPGGTRWNPTQEQIGILEMLYRGGMRTPTAQQIEQITAQLSKYGKIEGKNVFYWFQNHKARERQKLKRNNNLLALSHQNTSAHTSAGAPTNPAVLNTTITLDLDPKGEFKGREESTSPCKRMCRSWTFEPLEVDNKVLVNNFREEAGHDKTLELFPLHPEGR